jgi:RNA polymerase sigma-70 factor (ECF subfamily)
MSSPSPDTSASLLDKVRGTQAPGEWNRLVHLYTPLLHRWLASAHLQPADRDDVTQRVLAILVDRLPHFEHNGKPGAFRCWLRGIVTNLLHEFWRGRPATGAESVLDQLADPEGGLSRLWDEQHDHHVLHALMDAVLPEFTPATRQAFRRVALEGAAARDVAQELGLSVNAVLIAKSRVLARLRQEARGLVD